MSVTISTDESVKRSVLSSYSPHNRGDGYEHNEGTVQIRIEPIATDVNRLIVVELRGGVSTDVIGNRLEYMYRYPSSIELLGGKFTNIANREFCIFLETESLQMYIKLIIDDNGNVSPTNAVVRRERTDHIDINVGLYDGHSGNYYMKVGKLDTSNGYTDVKFSLDNDKIGPWWIELKFHFD